MRALVLVAAFAVGGCIRDPCEPEVRVIECWPAHRIVVPIPGDTLLQIEKDVPAGCRRISKRHNIDSGGSGYRVLLVPNS